MHVAATVFACGMWRKQAYNPYCQRLQLGNSSNSGSNEPQVVSPQDTSRRESDGGDCGCDSDKGCDQGGACCL